MLNFTQRYLWTVKETGVMILRNWNVSIDFSKLRHIKSLKSLTGRVQCRNTFIALPQPALF